MRLQVAILRHQLPPVRLLFNTTKQHGPGSQPLTTIADLLFALNALVPLESTRDGEWGFEDYVVEVAATSDQEFNYECLHYQEISDVLHEDDEVVVRALSSIDLRDRRLGGRLQISNDGRHLIDGLSWGSRWRGQAARPEIDIPPRKRRRITLEEEEAVPQIEYLLGQQASKSLGALIDDEDHESDEDFHDEQSEIDSSTTETSDDASDDEETKPLLQIMASEMFDNADQDSDAVSDSSSMSEEDLTGELHEILRDGDDLHLTSRKKRKRDDDIAPGLLSFEGFSSPEKPPIKTWKNLRNPGRYQRHAVDSDDRLNSPSSESDVEEADETSSPDSSSNVSSESQDDSDSENTMSEDSEESSSSSDDDSDEPSSSASDVSSSQEFARPKLRQPGTRHVDAAVAKRSDLVESALPLVPEQTRLKTSVPPGSGTNKTKRNNDRKRMGKQLKFLKAEGKIDINANYADLREYNKLHANSDLLETEGNNREDVTDDVLNSRKQLLLGQLDNFPTDNENVHDNLVSSPSAEVGNASRQEKLHEIENPNHQVSLPESSVPLTRGQNFPNSPQPKSRLDLASSRRMLFNSLGVRNPKTAAAEQVVREQLSKPSRNVNSKQETSTKPLSGLSCQQSDAWKDKLVVSAVECVQKGRIIPAPTFPFKHPWQVRKETFRMSEQQSNSLMDHNQLDYDEDNTHTRSGSSNHRLRNEDVDKPAPASTTSRAVTAGMDEDDDMPIPEEPQNLSRLQPGEFGKHSIITYKELHMNSRFEPEESSYRVARVLGIEGSIIQVLLSKKDRTSTEIRYDEETGERIFGKFEMPLDDDDTADDGYRELSFDQMIDPRIVTISSNVQVTSSDKHGTQNEEPSRDYLSSNEHGPQVVPESDVQIEIDGEIGNENFHSQFDENLLRPIEQTAAIDQHVSKKANDAQMGHFNDESSDFEGTSSSAEKPKITSSSAAHNKQHANNERITEQDEHSDLNGDPLSKPTHADSSSHQDAQRLSSAYLADEEGPIAQTTSWDNTSQLVHEIKESTLKQARMLQTDDNANGSPTPAEIVHGNGTSHNDSEVESNFSLPSLKAIASSQTHESPNRRTSARLSNRSPSTSDRNLRSQERNLSSSPTPNFDPVTLGAELSVKSSQSQHTRLSQVPQHDGTVDLTISSDTLEPIDTIFDKDISQSATRKTRQSTRSLAPSGLSSKAFKSSFTGLGSKTTLPGKKKTSHV